jgi:hypothetical protein
MAFSKDSWIPGPAFQGHDAKSQNHIIFSLRQDAFFKKNNRRRLKFTPEKADIFLEASEIQVERRNDS